MRGGLARLFALPVVPCDASGVIANTRLPAANTLRSTT
jgi:hypothetical protein